MITVRLINREGWKDGPWTEEEDLYRWITDPHEYYRVFTCVISRHPTRFHLCGYVGVQGDHPLYGISYNGALFPEDIKVHGGITYSGDRTPTAKKDGIFWWSGFDCGHSFDFSPGDSEHLMDAYRYYGGDCTKESLKLLISSHLKYKTFDYVKKEVDSLADQLSKIRHLKCKECGHHVDGREISMGIKEEIK